MESASIYLRYVSKILPLRLFLLVLMIADCDEQDAANVIKSQYVAASDSLNFSMIALGPPS